MSNFLEAFRLRYAASIIMQAAGMGKANRCDCGKLDFEHGEDECR